MRSVGLGAPPRFPLLPRSGDLGVPPRFPLPSLWGDLGGPPRFPLLSRSGDLGVPFRFPFSRLGDLGASPVPFPLTLRDFTRGISTTQPSPMSGALTLRALRRDDPLPAMALFLAKETYDFVRNNAVRARGPGSGRGEIEEKACAERGQHITHEMSGP